MSGVSVTVQMERLVITDDGPDTSYLHQDYRDVKDPAEREKYLAQDRARVEAYDRGEWHFIGVRARAHVEVRRGKNITCYTIDSAGLWGIESDSDDSYLEEVFREEAAQLEADIKALGEAKR